MARGADAVGYFQWRASRAGAEKFHSALVPHAGTDTKVWHEVCELGGILARAADAAGTRVEPARVALVFDWQARWAGDLDSHPSRLVRYLDQPKALHRALWSRGTAVDFVRPGADLSGFSVVLVPSLYLVDEETVGAIHRFVARGGHAVVTYFSGIVDENDHVRLGGYPGAFAELLGISTEEFFPLRDGETVRLVAPGDDGPGWLPARAAGTVWTELTHLRGAEAMAVYADGPVAGRPAVTRHASGPGVAWYLGTALDERTLSAVLTEVLGEAGVASSTTPGNRVEVVRRRGGDRSFVFVINHSDTDAVVAADGYDLVTETTVTGSVRVPAGRCAVVRERV